jgi:penicillin-binding protein 2
MGTLGVDQSTIAFLHDALHEVTISGTSAGVFAGFPIATAGKTGTAQVSGKQNTSLFVGFTPIQNPRYVVAVVVEEGGYGAETAAPIARAIFEALNGLPVGPVSSLAYAGGN